MPASMVAPRGAFCALQTRALAKARAIAADADRAAGGSSPHSAGGPKTPEPGVGVTIMISLTAQLLQTSLGDRICIY